MSVLFNKFIKAQELEIHLVILLCLRYSEQTIHNRNRVLDSKIAIFLVSRC